MTTSGPHSISIGSTSSGLIAKVKAHDAEGWSRLVHLYGPLVDFWIRQAGLQDADGQDVFQEAFAAVARGIERFRRDRPGDTFRGWLRVIVRNKLSDHHRRGQVQPVAIGGSIAQERIHQLAADASSDHPDETNAIHQLRLRGLGLIQAEFEERTWTMFWRTAIDEQPTREVAEEFGVTTSAVRLAKSRVLRRLREELGDAKVPGEP